MAGKHGPARTTRSPTASTLPVRISSMTATNGNRMAEYRRWGFWGTTIWSVLLLALFVALQVAFLFFYITVTSAPGSDINYSEEMTRLRYNGDVLHDDRLRADHSRRDKAQARFAPGRLPPPHCAAGAHAGAMVGGGGSLRHRFGRDVIAHRQSGGPRIHGGSLFLRRPQGAALGRHRPGRPAVRGNLLPRIRDSGTGAIESRNGGRRRDRVPGVGDDSRPVRPLRRRHHFFIRLDARSRKNKNRLP